MDRRRYQQNAIGGFEEMRMGAVLCPKPLRFGLFRPSIAEPMRHLRCPVNDHIRTGDSGTGSELLDIILSKRGYGAERSSIPMASSPPIFWGSPPVRAPNPVIQDAQFGMETITPSSPAALSSAWKGSGPAGMKFTHKPAAVRIEGFDCLGQDHGTCSVATLALIGPNRQQC